jgi:hypothetical protein
MNAWEQWSNHEGGKGMIRDYAADDRLSQPNYFTMEVFT